MGIFKRIFGKKKTEKTREITEEQKKSIIDFLASLKEIKRKEAKEKEIARQIGQAEAEGNKELAGELRDKRSLLHLELRTLKWRSASKKLRAIEILQQTEENGD